MTCCMGAAFIWIHYVLLLLIYPHVYQPVLGQMVARPAKLDKKLARELRALSEPDDPYETVMGRTMCTYDFYEGKCSINNIVSSHMQASNKLTETEDSALLKPKSATGPNPKPPQSNQHSHNPYPQDKFYYDPPILYIMFHTAVFEEISPIRILYFSLPQLRYMSSSL